MQVNLTDSCDNIHSTSSNSRHSRSVACGIHCAQEHHNVFPRRLASGGFRGLVQTIFGKISVIVTLGGGGGGGGGLRL